MLLMNTAEEQLPDLIAQLVQKEENCQNRQEPVMIKSTDWLSIGPTPDLAVMDRILQDGGHVISCSNSQSIQLCPDIKGRLLHLKCRTGKLGSRDLRQQLPKVTEFIRRQKHIESLFICCVNGRDLSVGAGLAVLCLCSRKEGSPFASTRNHDLFLTVIGQFSVETADAPLNKTVIKQKLASIMTSHPTAKPSRATLQSVHDLLLTPKDIRLSNSNALLGDPGEKSAFDEFVPECCRENDDFAR